MSRVIATVECPSRSLMTLGCMPACRARVAQVVEAGRGQPGAAGAPLKAAAEPVGVQRLTVLAGEHQITCRPARAEREPLSGLPARWARSAVTMPGSNAISRRSRTVLGSET